MDYVWSSSTNNVYILSYVLFAFEINIRASAVLGLVGAGGIGLFYDSTLGLFQYPKTAMIILFTLVIVVIIDYVSSKVRENSHDTRTASVRKEISSEIKGTQTKND